MEKITLEKIQELHDFLTDENIPDCLTIEKRIRPNLSDQKAFTIIWYLQEHLNIIPSNFEICCSCKDIYDSEKGGFYNEKFGRFYCDICRKG